jgi:hypothetical protein
MNLIHRRLDGRPRRSVPGQRSGRREPGSGAHRYLTAEFGVRSAEAFPAASGKTWCLVGGELSAVVALLMWPMPPRRVRLMAGVRPVRVHRTGNDHGRAAFRAGGAGQLPPRRAPGAGRDLLRAGSPSCGPLFADHPQPSRQLDVRGGRMGCPPTGSRRRERMRIGELGWGTVVDLPGLGCPFRRKPREGHPAPTASRPRHPPGRVGTFGLRLKVFSVRRRRRRGDELSPG